MEILNLMLWDDLKCIAELYLQLLRHDEAVLGTPMKPRRPRAVVLCPTRELSEQVLDVF